MRMFHISNIKWINITNSIVGCAWLRTIVCPGVVNIGTIMFLLLQNYHFMNVRSPRQHNQEVLWSTDACCSLWRVWIETQLKSLLFSVDDVNSFVFLFLTSVIIHYYKQALQCCQKDANPLISDIEKKREKKLSIYYKYYLHITDKQ